MSKKKKQTLIIVGCIEAAILIFCLVISILVLTTITISTELNLSQNGPFIGTLQNNSVLFFCTICVPLFIIFIVDGVYLIFYAQKKESAVSDEERDAIAEEAKRQAREEVMKELAEENAKKNADPDKK